MRYILIVLGLGAVVFGIINWGETEAHLAPVKVMILAGVIAASVGAATIDIMAALNRSKN